MTEKLEESIDLEVEFKTWMEGKLKPNGGNYSEITIDRYIYALKRVCKEIKTFESEYKINIFNIDSLHDLNIISEAIKTSEDFDRVNKHFGNRTLDAGINKYFEFLGFRNKKDDIAEKEIDNLLVYEIFNMIKRTYELPKESLEKMAESYNISEDYFENYDNKYFKFDEERKTKTINDISYKKYLDLVKNVFYKKERKYFAINKNCDYDRILKFNDEVIDDHILIHDHLSKDSIKQINKGDIFFAYSKERVSGVGIAISSPIKIFEEKRYKQIGFLEDAEEYEKLGVLIYFPILLNQYAIIKNIKNDLNTNDLEQYNNTNNSIYYIEDEVNYKVLMNLVYKANPNLKSDFEYILGEKKVKDEGEKDLIKPKIDFDIDLFVKHLDESGLIYSKQMVVRFVASLFTKPFVILTGLSGSGKTQLALSFVRWICNKENTKIQLLKQALESDEIKKIYDVKTFSEDIIEIINKNGTSGKIIPLPTDLIYEWYESIALNEVDKDVSARDMRDIMNEDSNYQKHIHGFYNDIKRVALKMYELKSSDTIADPINQYEILPVGSEWTSSEPLLGFPNALQPDKYESPDNGVLDLLTNANNNPDKPFFLILDEMNLSHVERYFSDFLSVMESGEEIPLYNSLDDRGRIPSSIKLPNNLFIIGTVNIDETTYMFSPKVLDRANTIEFRINPDEMEYFLENSKELNVNSLRSKGADMSDSFLDIARDRSFERDKFVKYNDVLLKFFTELSKVGSEFGYRSISEIHLLIEQLSIVNPNIDDDEILDVALMQKILPKLHGSRRKILPILKILADLCVRDEGINIEREILSEDDFNFKESTTVKYPLSLEKISRMYRNAIDLGYTSYSEA